MHRRLPRRHSACLLQRGILLLLLVRFAGGGAGSLENEYDRDGLRFRATGGVNSGDCDLDLTGFSGRPVDSGEIARLHNGAFASLVDRSTQGVALLLCFIVLTGFVMFRDRLEDRDHGGHTAAVYQHVESLDRLASAGGDSQPDGAARGKLLEGRYSEYFDTNCRRHSRLVIRNFDSDVPGELDPVGVEGDDPSHWQSPAVRASR